ncbi:hypothetical protein SAMN04487995_0597 [Dyadobacter koreensis]|uniref:HTH cro/C1-type domain-containing protein n=1 Tax=Dyadobacter koreensis TaxID=408657 RepID=A0A1H6QTN4_9BACT|nr:hypothetical protein [Dyadobacter koreensis]SEI42332.1 hypothetical protein SAMN04487995_0597 [Dyadobacter koreensis]
MSVKERLKEYIHLKKISTRQFEIQLGLSNGYINNIKKSISRATLENISMKHPNLNLEWLLLGEGEMLKGGVV